VTTTVDTPAITHHRRDVQGMRALAVVAVLLYHGGGLLPGGFIGVDLFFVISGYVITLLLAREWAQRGRIDLVRFYARRFRRLSPPLALVVLVTLAVSLVVESPLGSIQTTTSTAVGAMLFCANVVIAITSGGYFDAAAETNPLLHTWSLAVEEQFYFVFPIVLIVSWKLARRAGQRFGQQLSRWVPIAVLGAASAVSLALALAPQFGIEPFGYRTAEITFYSPITRSWEFGAGVLVALAGPRLRIAHRALATALAAAALVVIAWCSLAFDSSTVHPGTATLLPVVATVVLLVACSDPATPIARLLGSRPLHWIGDISYSWYLWHWPLIVFTTLLVTDEPLVLLVVSLASIVPAMVSYRYVEQPLRRGEGIARYGMPRLVALTLGVPIAVAIAVGGAARTGFWNDEVRAMQDAVLSDHAAYSNGCSNALLGPVWTASGCTWNDGADGKWVYLVGDSHADHLSEALIGAAAETARPLRIATSNGCPFTGLMMERADWPDAYNAGCQAMNRDLVDWLAGQPAGTVVISNTNSYFEASSHAFGPTLDELTSDTSAKVDAYRVATLSLVAILEQAGHDVVLVQPVPYWGGDPYWDPLRCSVFDIIGGHCADSTDLTATLEQRAGARRALDEAAAESGAQLVDLRDVLCPEGRCGTERNGVVLYRDNSHLSVGASTGTSPVFAVLLRTP